MFCLSDAGKVTARLCAPVALCLMLIGCGGGYSGILEESLANSIEFSRVDVTTEGASGRADSDNERMPEVAPAVRTALENRFKARLSPGANYTLKVRITYVDIPSRASAGMNLYGGRLNGEAQIVGADGVVVATANVLAAPKASGPNRSSVQGIPVGILLSAAATAAGKPDGLPRLAASFADETSEALVGR